MSDARPSKPGRRAGIRLGDVPVLALLAAAALAGYAVFGREEPAPAPAVVAAPVPAAPAPAPDPAPVAAIVSAPADESPVAEPVAEPPPAPPVPTVEPPATAVGNAPALASLRNGLAEVRCADLRVASVDGRVKVAGTVTASEDRERVQALVDALPAELAQPPEVAVASPALCEPLALTEPLRATGLGVAAVPGDAVLTGGQDLVLDVRAADLSGFVRVDYFTVDGGVVHLLPNPSEPAARLEAGAPRRLGERTGRTRFWTIGPPFGHELIVVVVSPAPLFAAPRPEAEPAATYLPELKRALAEPGAAGAAAAALFITTRAP